MESPDMITILGHTAGGKTLLAAWTASMLGGEVISADSRQVYRGMTIGTGKDFDDYKVMGKMIPYHLVDIVDAGYEYNVYEFQNDFLKVYNSLKRDGKFPVLCGGSGLYIESVLRQYDMLYVPVNEDLRAELEVQDLEDLKEILYRLRPLHNKTDTENKKRAIRAIEIAKYVEKHGQTTAKIPHIRSLNFGLGFEVEERRRRITERLKQRLSEGMVDEVKALLNSGIDYEKLDYYGLEYRYISRHLKGLISYDEMFSQLNTAIHQFAKRQMTYFRGMERRGIEIHWIKGELSLEKKLNEVLMELGSI